MYLVGRIAEKDDSDFRNGLVEVNGARNLPRGVNPFRQAIAANHGGTYTDYFVFEVTSDLDRGRIENGDEFDLVWVGDAIDGVDFALEDAKWIADFTTDKDDIDGDGADEAIVSVKVYQSDGVTPATLNVTKIIPIIKNGRGMYLRLTLVDGEATWSVSQVGGGDVRIPSVNRLDIPNVRVRSVADIRILELLN